ncbi:MAG: SEL1-like repeat protein [Nitrospinaceae bacterium]|nr:SEL1-like repeat protein [Nitrospinaceae bacterium]
MNIIKKISTLILGFSMIFVSLSWADDDPQTAKMRSACDTKKNSAACFRMGERYRIVERDNKNALIFYKKSCDAGYMTGCTNGGNLLYMKGTQYGKEWKEAK